MGRHQWIQTAKRNQGDIPDLRASCEEATGGKDIFGVGISENWRVENRSELDGW